MSKNNVDNLISLADRTTNEQRKIAKKGGKASGKARQEKKRLQEALQQALKGKYDIDGEMVTGYNATVISLIKRVIATGDPAAFNAIRDLIGEKPVDKVESDSQVTVKMDINKDFLK